MSCCRLRSVDWKYDNARKFLCEQVLWILIFIIYCRVFYSYSFIESLRPSDRQCWENFVNKFIQKLLAVYSKVLSQIRPSTGSYPKKLYLADSLSNFPGNRQKYFIANSRPADSAVPRKFVSGPEKGRNLFVVQESLKNKIWWKLWERRRHGIGTEVNLWDGENWFPFKFMFSSMILLEGNQIWSLFMGILETFPPPTTFLC